MTSPFPPGYNEPPSVVEQEILEEVMNITSEGPAPRWETREERYAAFLMRDDFRTILGELAREVFRSRVAAERAD